ncbi:small ribosomal subunit protein bS18m-like [Gorilla gorilla gorilla]|uniref:small ribosomal subunit protein bS18m-like n=1 Tax=Gorilla gorilla gorilla TaxID=9595 RepID=UPI0008F4AA4D
MVAVCGGLGRKKLTHLVTAAVSLTHPGTPMVLSRRGYSQYKQVSSIEDLPSTLQVFVGRNRKKSQKQLRELK